VAREHRPLLKAFQARVRVADKSVSIARAGYLPQLGATATYNRNAPTTERFFGDPYQQNTVGANVLLSWNLFSEGTEVLIRTGMFQWGSDVLGGIPGPSAGGVPVLLLLLAAMVPVSAWAMARLLRAPMTGLTHA
jgi:hypothetical protein